MMYKNYMKAMIIFLVLGISSAHAELTVIDSEFGPGTILQDDVSGLEWLNITQTEGRTYEDIVSQFARGGEFNGFRHATVEEVFELAKEAGGYCFDLSDARYYDQSCGDVRGRELVNFMSQLGVDETVFAAERMNAFSGGFGQVIWGGVTLNGTQNMSLQVFYSLVGDGFDLESWVDSYGQLVVTDYEFGNQIGHFLVRLSPVGVTTTAVIPLRVVCRNLDTRQSVIIENIEVVAGQKLLQIAKQQAW